MWITRSSGASPDRRVCNAIGLVCLIITIAVVVVLVGRTIELNLGSRLIRTRVLRSWIGTKGSGIVGSVRGCWYWVSIYMVPMLKAELELRDLSRMVVSGASVGRMQGLRLAHARQIRCYLPITDECVSGEGCVASKQSLPALHGVSVRGQVCFQLIR